MNKKKKRQSNGTITPLLLQVCDEDLKKLAERIGQDRRYSTYQRQLRLRQLIAEYLASLNQEDIPLSCLTERFIHDYAAYLSSRRLYAGGTVWLACQFLKGVVSRACQRGLMQQNPFVAFHIGRHIRERDYLTTDELKDVIACKIQQPYQALCRDLFVLSALTGMAYIDISRLAKGYIRQIDGEQWIIAQRYKTGTPFQIRLLPMAVGIIQYYSKKNSESDLVFPYICYRTIAKHMPLLMKRCGIHRKITFHCARHTYAILALDAGIPIESISRSLGHTHISTTQIYARITMQKLSRDLDRLQTFCDKNLVVTRNLPNFAGTTRLDNQYMADRKYPVGIQTFERIIRGGYVYVDKTDLMWELAHYAKFVFMSRPRRFGKSLLTTTLDSYFKGERELFEGLKIMQYEQEWESYPVLHLDLSSAKHMPTKQVKEELGLIVRPYETVYGRDIVETTPGMRLSGVIDRAYTQTGKQVVVIIDEYDAPLLDVLHEDQELKKIREVMQEFYQRLKKQEAKIRFCFITGITKFSQLSIFSTINNLKNVTMLPRFSAICGITEQEVRRDLAVDIKAMSEVYGCSPEEMFEKIKLRYDGYHFASVSDDIYNPYSLLNALVDQQLDNYWFASGTPTFLIHQLQHFKTNIMSLDKLEVPSSAFDQPTENMQDALPLLYQSGYLTIKDYDREGEVYTLSIPNQEVRIGYVKGLLPIYTGLNDADVQVGFSLKFWRALKQGDADKAMREMQSYMAGIPYVEGFKQKLADAATAEGFYEYTLYLIFSMLNVYVRTQVKCAGGRVDMVVLMPDTIYVFELKVNGTAQEALDQINSKHYALPYQTDGRRVVKVGVKFEADTRIPEEWAIEE